MAIYYTAGPRRFSTVVMDGSNDDVVHDIIHVVRTLIKGRGRFCSCMPVDEGRLTMFTIDVFTTKTVYNELEREISRRYPGLCMFDPPMVVG